MITNITDFNIVIGPSFTKEYQKKEKQKKRWKINFVV